MPGAVGRACYSSSSSLSSSSSSSSSSESSAMRFRWTGCVCETSSSDSHSGQLRISPSSTSSSSTSISAEHSGQRITAPPSVHLLAKWGYEDRARHRAAYYIPRRRKSTPVHGSTARNAIASRAEGPFQMTSSREYPERPVVGIGGVIIDQGRTLLIRRGSEPLRGEWSIPGGTLELGETLEEGVVREEELNKYRLTETATRILKKAFAMDRARRAAK